MSKYSLERLQLATVSALTLVTSIAAAIPGPVGGRGIRLIPANSLDSNVIAASNDNGPSNDNGLGVQPPDASSNSNSPATADKQPNNKTDIATAASVRKALVNDNSLSTYAHNVTVNANGGVVTLRGEVKDNNEKMAVENAAHRAQGVNQVINQVQVKQQ
jgi:hypothetical protein